MKPTRGTDNDSSFICKMHRSWEESLSLALNRAATRFTRNHYKVLTAHLNLQTNTAFTCLLAGSSNLQEFDAVSQARAVRNWRLLKRPKVLGGSSMTADSTEDVYKEIILEAEEKFMASGMHKRRVVRHQDVTLWKTKWSLFSCTMQKKSKNLQITRALFGMVLVIWNKVHAECLELIASKGTDSKLCSLTL